MSHLTASRLRDTSVISLTVALTLATGPALSTVTIDAIPIGNPGNLPDFTGYGRVDHEFALGKYEVTIGQYTEFLNAIAKTDTYGLYDELMAKNPNIAGIRQSGPAGSFVYNVIDNHGSSANRPVLFVSWFDAARFANWMSNGQPQGEQTSATTEDGAYTLNGAVSGYAPERNAVNPNNGAAPSHFLPTEDEWYKAAYYSPRLNGDTGGYYIYATQSDVRPSNQIGSAPNQANYFDGVYTTTRTNIWSVDANYLTDVGTFQGSASYYGTFDQNGNVFEWNDLDGKAGLTRGMRGGNYLSYTTDSDLESTARIEYVPSSASNATGFRLASPTRAVAVEMVTVGDPGNTNDPATGGIYGGVARAFQIGKYEVTIGQYVAFLNAVAARDPYQLYNPLMQSYRNSAGIKRSGDSGSYYYEALDNGGSSANRPVTFVSWFDTARFANWMSNGQPPGDQTSRTTENGAYALNGMTGGPALARNAINPNTGAVPTYFIPTESEWYKAAYYSPALNTGTGGYYSYATQSNDYPGNIVGNPPNQVNYVDTRGVFAVTQQSVYSTDQNYLTDVGAFRNSFSFYGTFDQNGNVYEWNDLNGLSGRVRGLRGGCWYSGADPAQDLSPLNVIVNLPTYESSVIGMRLARPFRTIMITGTRGSGSTARSVFVNGETTGLGGKSVAAWFKVSGHSSYQKGPKVQVREDGSFNWNRKTRKGIAVYFQAGRIRSNDVIIPAEQ